MAAQETEQKFRDHILESMRDFGRDNDKSLKIVAEELRLVRAELEDIKSNIRAGVKFLVSQ